MVTYHKTIETKDKQLGTRTRPYKQRVRHKTNKKKRTITIVDENNDEHCSLCKCRGHKTVKCKDICLPCLYSYEKMGKDCDSPSDMEPINNKQMSGEYYKSIQSLTSLAKYPIHFDQDCPLRCFVCHNVRHSPSECLKVCQFHTDNCHAVGKCPEYCNYCGSYGHVLLSCSSYCKDYHPLQRFVHSKLSVQIDQKVTVKGKRTRLRNRCHKKDRSYDHSKSSGSTNNITLGSYLNDKLSPLLCETINTPNITKNASTMEKPVAETFTYDNTYLPLTEPQKSSVCENGIHYNYCTNDDNDSGIYHYVNKEAFYSPLELELSQAKNRVTPFITDLDITNDFAIFCNTKYESRLPIFLSVDGITSDPCNTPNCSDPVYIPNNSRCILHDPVIKPPFYRLF